MEGPVVSGSRDIGGHLPHGAEARFVHDIDRLDAESIVARGAVPAGGRYDRDGRAPAVVAVELAAQAAGVLEASRSDGPAAVGYIVGLRELELDVDDVPTGQELVAQVDLEGMARPLTVYSVRVTLGGADVLRGKLSVFTENASDG